MNHAPDDVTNMLIQWSEGDPEALNRLVPVIYDELHRIAERYFRKERSNNTLQPTALVNEVYLRLVHQSDIDWQNRAQFFGIAAKNMRRILVERARARNAAKRGNGDYKLDLTQVSDIPNNENPLDLPRIGRWRNGRIAVPGTAMRRLVENSRLLIPQRAASSNASSSVARLRRFKPTS